MSEILCSHCGQPNSPDASFCAHCGTALESTNIPADDAQNIEPVEPGHENETPEGEPEQLEQPLRFDQSTEPEPGESSKKQESEPEPPAPRPTHERPRLRRPRLEPRSDLFQSMPGREPLRPTSGEHAEDETDPFADQPWLRPQKAEPAEAPQSPPDQPWLRPELEDVDAEKPPRPAPQRRITGLQGLLEPADVAWALSDTQASATIDPGLSDDQLRRLRTGFHADIPLTDDPPPQSWRGAALRRHVWIYWLLLVVMGGGLLFGSAGPENAPHEWPGVAESFEFVNQLPEGTLVLINWAYDPATSGEMDIVARPVLEHLLERRARFLVVSQLPGGPATARRLIDRASAQLQRIGRIQEVTPFVAEGGYLPGGAATLPLLGQAPTVGVPVDLQGKPAETVSILSAFQTTRPGLSLVVAARSEDVQRWLEQVQPLDRTPVIALVSAGADPGLRPYWDSGQLAGMVSGFDGGITYRRLLNRPLLPPEQRQLSWQLAGQGFGLIVLVIVIVLGNLAALTERDRG
jgi:hypothetical protein